MTSTQVSVHPPLPSWWKILAIVTMLFGFAVLIGLTVEAYRQAPPIPAKVVDPTGKTVFTHEDVSAGQQVFLKYGLMANGTIWGHGAYLGPDFSAHLSAQLGRRGGRPGGAGALPASLCRAHAGAARRDRRRRGAGDEAQPLRCRDRHAALLRGRCRRVRAPGRVLEGLLRRRRRATAGWRSELIDDPQELRQLTAFFAWAAWASTAERPGTSHSYTNNFPYDPLAGNALTGGAVVWSALSLVFLLGGTGIVLLAFGKFDHLGWHRPERSAGACSPSCRKRPRRSRRRSNSWRSPPLLFLGQTLIGGGVAHYRAEPGDFYGFDLSRLFCRAICCAPGICSSRSSGSPPPMSAARCSSPACWAATSRPGSARPSTCCSAPSSFVAVGSLLGEWAGILQWLGAAWFWFGNQGWEYLEIGRAWQILLAIGLVFWFVLLWRAVRAGAARSRSAAGSSCSS